MSKSEMAPMDSSSSAERVSKREAGGGCCPPPPNCTYSSNRCGNSPNVDCWSSIASSCCPPRCEGHSPPQPSSCCESCVSTLRPILKRKRGCCCDRCSGSDSSCMCQPMPRGCNCPPPVQVDARATRECTCDCPSSPECACPPSERRFPRTTRTCPNARLCRPFIRLPPDPKCHNNCTRYQPCLPPPCDPCTSRECRAPTPAARSPCGSCSPCPSCSPCRPASAASTKSSCRPPTSCKRLSICDECQGPSVCSKTGQSCHGINDAVCSIPDGVEEREETSDTRDRDGSSDYCCAMDRVEPGEQPGRAGDSRDSILDEGSVEDSTSKTSVNSLLNAANSSSSVEPDLTDTPGNVALAVESAPAVALEDLEDEKSTKDSQSVSPPLSSPLVPPENRAEIDRNTFRVHPSVARNILRNLVRAKLSSRAGSAARRDFLVTDQLSPGEISDDQPRAHAEQPTGVSVNTSATRRNDRRRGAGGSPAGNAVDTGGSSREIRVIRWNVSKLPSSVTRDHSTSTPLRSNRASVVFSPRKSRQPLSISSQSDRRER